MLTTTIELMATLEPRPYHVEEILAKLQDVYPDLWTESPTRKTPKRSLNSRVLSEHEVGRDNDKEKHFKRHGVGTYSLLAWDNSVSLVEVSISTLSESVLGEEDEERDYLEGAEHYRLHRYRERNAQLVQAAKAAWSKAGGLSCEVCGFEFEARFGNLGAGFIEAHHRTPISKSNSFNVSIKDLAPVCANCHRMLHRKGGTTVELLRASLLS